MKQISLGLNLSTKKTRKREFLEEMERVVPWALCRSVWNATDSIRRDRRERVIGQVLQA
jgi:hypothetical protein